MDLALNLRLLLWVKFFFDILAAGLGQTCVAKQQTQVPFLQSGGLLYGLDLQGIA